MKEYIYGFEKLTVWQKALDFVDLIYQETQNFPDEEKYGLTNQIRRSSISIPSNIAEGTSRHSYKDQAHFSQLAFSSLTETVNHLFIAHRLKYINKELLDSLKIRILEISNLLNALRNSQLKNHRSNQQINKSNQQINKSTNQQ
jgi:four helix bundle protein